MWKYNRTIRPDELYHHKYIAKIGYGPSARYFYTQEQLNAYRKALSSKDELNNAYNISQEHRGKVQSLKSDFRDNTNKGTKTKRREKAIKNNLDVLEDRAKSNWINDDAPGHYRQKTKEEQESTNKDYNKLKQASDDYERAKTKKGKMEDVKKVFDQYHPETAKKIKRGKEKFKKFFG